LSGSSFSLSFSASSSLTIPFPFSLGDSEQRFKDIDGEFDQAREDTRKARDAFNSIKKKRCDLFNKAFKHIEDRIDEVYKDLTKGKASPQGGVAYLSLEEPEVRRF
jgi:structural maintenance of chromosome 1